MFILSCSFKPMQLSEFVVSFLCSRPWIFFARFQLTGAHTQKTPPKPIKRRPSITFFFRSSSCLCIAFSSERLGGTHLCQPTRCTAFFTITVSPPWKYATGYLTSSFHLQQIINIGGCPLSNCRGHGSLLVSAVSISFWDCKLRSLETRRPVSSIGVPWR